MASLSPLAQKPSPPLFPGSHFGFSGAPAIFIDRPGLPRSTHSRSVRRPRRSPLFSNKNRCRQIRPARRGTLPRAGRLHRLHTARAAALSPARRTQTRRTPARYAVDSAPPLFTRHRQITAAGSRHHFLPRNQNSRRPRRTQRRQFQNPTQRRQSS